MATRTLPDTVPHAANARFSSCDRRAVALPAGLIAVYAICLLPVAQGQYDAIFDTIHAFSTVGVFVTAIVALGDVAIRKLLGRRSLFSAVDAGWYAFAALLTGITIPVYGIFKQLVLPARGFPLDPVLAAIDRALFLGHDPWAVTHALIGVVPTALIDSLYAAWMVLMFLFPTFVVATIRPAATRARLLLCWLAVWIVIGSVAAWLLASAGPIFYDTAVAPSASFRALDVDLIQIAAQASALGLPMGAPEFQPMLLAGLQQGQYHAAGGISAMPSVHVSMAALFVVAGFQINRVAGWIAFLLATIIWIGSIHLGWHYACDGIVGTAMVWVLWRATARVVPWLDRDRIGRSARRSRAAAYAAE